MRLDAVAALESIQEAIRSLDDSWPAPDADVRARLQDADVVVWFHSPAGNRVPAPITLPRAAFD